MVYMSESLHASMHCRTFTRDSLSSVVQLCLTLCDPWTTARQASLSITNSWSLLRLMSIKSVIPSNHLILCRPLLLLPSIFPSIRIFSNQSVLRIRGPKYWSFSFNISPSNKYSGLISFRIDLRDTEKAMAPHSRTLAWKIPWMEEPGQYLKLISQ